MYSYYSLAIWVKVFGYHLCSKEKPKAIDLFPFFLFAFLCFIHKGKGYLFQLPLVIMGSRGYALLSWVPLILTMVSITQMWPSSLLQTQRLHKWAVKFHWKFPAEKLETARHCWISWSRLACIRLAESRVGTSSAILILIQQETKQNSLPVPLAYDLLSVWIPWILALLPQFRIF